MDQRSRAEMSMIFLCILSENLSVSRQIFSWEKTVVSYKYFCKQGELSQSVRVKMKPKWNYMIRNGKIAFLEWKPQTYTIKEH